MDIFWAVVLLLSSFSGLLDCSKLITTFEAPFERLIFPHLTEGSKVLQVKRIAKIKTTTFLNQTYTLFLSSKYFHCLALLPRRMYIVNHHLQIIHH